MGARTAAATTRTQEESLSFVLTAAVSQPALFFAPPRPADPDIPKVCREGAWKSFCRAAGVMIAALLLVRSVKAKAITELRIFFLGLGERRYCTSRQAAQPQAACAQGPRAAGGCHSASEQKRGTAGPVLVMMHGGEAL